MFLFELFVVVSLNIENAAKIEKKWQKTLSLPAKSIKIVQLFVFLQPRQAATHQRRRPKPLRKLLFGEVLPPRFVPRRGVEQGVKMGVASHRRRTVVGTTTLARITPKQPAIQRDSLALTPLDGATGDATTGVNGAIRPNSPVGARLHTGTARAAPLPREGNIVAIRL
jgi:hypothetical protein